MTHPLNPMVAPKSIRRRSGHKTSSRPAHSGERCCRAVAVKYVAGALAVRTNEA